MKPYAVLSVILLIVSFILPVIPVCSQDASAPVVVRTDPPNQAIDVDPGLSELAVTFDRLMRDKSWSWVYEKKENFPLMTGDPRFLADRKTCLLPVRLKPDHTYLIWINSSRFKNFQDLSGYPAAPYRWTFRTSTK